MPPIFGANPQSAQSRTVIGGFQDPNQQRELNITNPMGGPAGISAFESPDQRMARLQMAAQKGVQNAALDLALNPDMQKQMAMHGLMSGGGGGGGGFSSNPYASQQRIGNKGGVMAPPSPNALQANGRAGMGSLDNFYASRTQDPNTGLALNPSSMDIFNNRARLQHNRDFEGLGATDAYYQGRNTNNPYLTMYAGGQLQDINSRRQDARRQDAMAQRRNALMQEADNFEAVQARAHGGPVMGSNGYALGHNPIGPQYTTGGFLGMPQQNPYMQNGMQGAANSGGVQSAWLGQSQPTVFNNAAQYGKPTTPRPVVALHMAKGGPTKPINPYLVGEKGPEIYQPDSGVPELIGEHGPEIRTFPQHGRIIPNDKIAKLKPMKDGGETKASRDIFGHTPEEDAAITATAKRRLSYLNPLNWFSAENNPPSAPQKRGFVSSSWITPEATQHLKERMQNVDYMPHPMEGLKELNAAVNPMADPYNGVTSLMDMISPRSRGGAAPPNMASAIYQPSASLIPSRVRGEDDILRSDPSRMPAPYQFPADNTAALTALGYINRYVNPYAGMSNDMRFMHAMDDARNGIVQRGDDGSAKFASGGGTIFNPATGQMEAYGPHVVRHDSVAFTPGHVKDDKGDLTRLNPKSQSTEKPSAPAPAKKLTQAELVAQYNRTHKEDPELTAKKKAIDEETAVLQSMTRPAAERIAQHYANKASTMSGRQLENVIGLPHVGDPETMTGVPMAPKGYLLPKLSNPYLSRQ